MEAAIVSNLIEGSKFLFRPSFSYNIRYYENIFLK